MRNIDKYKKKIDSINNNISKLLIDENDINIINDKYNNILAELNSKCSYQLTKINSYI